MLPLFPSDLRQSLSRTLIRTGVAVFIRFLHWHRDEFNLIHHQLRGVFY
jgi:hypothetical protein